MFCLKTSQDNDNRAKKRRKKKKKKINEVYIWSNLHIQSDCTVSTVQNMGKMLAAYILGSSIYHTDLIINHHFQSAPLHFYCLDNLRSECLWGAAAATRQRLLFSLGVSCVVWRCWVTLSQSSAACPGVNRWSCRWWLVSDLTQIGIQAVR